MPAKVFISCGQDTDPERLAAREAASWLETEGFAPYLAIKVNSIPDLNKGIIDELKRSDFFLFIRHRYNRTPEVSYRGYGTGTSN